jgi:hypothetical protein
VIILDQDIYPRKALFCTKEKEKTTILVCISTGGLSYISITFNPPIICALQTTTNQTNKFSSIPPSPRHVMCCSLLYACHTFPVPSSLFIYLVAHCRSDIKHDIPIAYCITSVWVICRFARNRVNLGYILKIFVHYTDPCNVACRGAIVVPPVPCGGHGFKSHSILNLYFLLRLFLLLSSFKYFHFFLTFI